MADKRRKSTNTKRKEQIHDLKEEVRQLQSELELQSLQQPSQSLLLASKLAENKALASAARQQQLGIASIQAALTPTSDGHPLCTRIRLGKSYEGRRAVLLAIREQKFRVAYDFISTRSEFCSEQSHFAEERFETADGDLCCAIYQTVQFPGAQSLKQVYDAVLFSLDNVEISISERLGHTTVRDDYDGLDSNIYNARVVSTNDRDITTEVSGIMFSQFFPAEDCKFGDGPCGMLVIDSVDEDELYPYAPSERVRKDVSAAFVLTADAPSNEGSASGDDGVLVTLRRAAFVKLHHPKFPVAEAAWQELQQDVARWGDVTTRAIRSVLYSVP